LRTLKQILIIVSNQFHRELKLCQGLNINKNINVFRNVRITFFLVVSFCLIIIIIILNRQPPRAPSKKGTDTPIATITQTFRTDSVGTNTFTPTGISTPVPGSLKYYLVDHVKNNADFAILAGWGINTAVVQFEINWSSTTWMSIFQSALDSNIKIVIWPTDFTNKRTNCDSGSPFPVSTNGDITKVEAMLETAMQYPNFIGIVNAHEWMWTSCPMTITEMAGLKIKLKAYMATDRPDVKVWNYTDSLESGYASSALPDNQIANIMDVAVIWKHCAGDADGMCDSSLARIEKSRARLNSLGLENQVELVYLIQTFTASSPYDGMFNLSELESYSCKFINTFALDGFGFYTWDAGWWPDLHIWTDLQPAIPYVHDYCLHMVP